MTVLMVLSSITFCLLAAVIAGGIYWGSKIRKYAASTLDDFMQKFNKYEEEQALKFSVLEEQLSDSDKKRREEIEQLKNELSEVCSKSSAAFEKITSQIAVLKETQDFLAVSAAESFQKLHTEQCEYQSKNDKALAEKTVLLTGLLEAADTKNNDAFEKVYAKFDEVAAQQKADASVATESIRQLRAEQNECQTKTDAAFAKNVTLLTGLLEAADTKNNDAFEKVYKKFNEITEQQKFDIAVTTENIRQLRAEQSDLLTAFKQKIAEELEALEACITQYADKNISELVSGFNKTEQYVSENFKAVLDKTSSNDEKVAKLAELQQKQYEQLNNTESEIKQKISALMDEIPSVKQSADNMEAVLLETFYQTASELQKGLSLANKDIVLYSNKLDLLTDRCTELAEHLTALKKEFAENFMHISSDFSCSRNIFQEKMTSFEASIDLILTEREELQKNFAVLAKAQAQNEIRQSKQNEDIKNLLDLRLAGVISTLQLLEKNLQQTSAGKTEKTVAKAEVKNTSPGNASQKQKQNIYSPNGDEIRFSQQSDGKTISKTYRKGKLCFEIIHSEWGVPEKGIMYSEDGKILKEFNYDSNGQVK